jgi:tetratricopeptide (TPR) repeat protein
MNRQTFSRTSVRFAVPLLAVALAGACDAFSPTEVKNPNLTDQQFLGTPAAGAAWLRGTGRQFLITLNNVVQNAEIASDNYYNNYTTNNQVFDTPTLAYIDPEVTSIQSSIARLRYMATFGLDSVFPRDPLVTANDKAELYYFRGVASLFAGESYVGLPAVPNGAVITWQEQLQSAIADFTQASSLSTDAAAKNSYTLARARAYYRLGNKAKAVEEATALLAANPTFIRNAVYDAVNGPANAMQGVLTSSVNNFQPLPRLDFLDPKYPNRGATVQSPLAFLKAEEAHLIIAEALLSDNNLTGAKDRLKQLLTLVNSRATELVDSRIQLRGRAGGKIVYPNASDIKVAFAPGQPLQDGFILTRTTANVRVPTISGTSVTAARIDAITTVDDGLYVLYLMRQEIFLGEGRRMADLGMRMPVAQTEIIANPSTKDGEPYTKPVIPAFIPAGFEMDAFTYDVAAKTVTMKHDMNRVLVQNKTSPDVLPFN